MHQQALAAKSAEAARSSESKISHATRCSAEGAALGERAAKFLSDIASRTKVVDDLIGQIAVASNEQTSGIQSVASSITELDALTQKNAQLASESSTAATELNSQTERLHEVAGAFTGLIEGSGADQTRQYNAPESSQIQTRGADSINGTRRGLLTLSKN